MVYLKGRGYLPEPFWQIRTYLPEPVPANKNLFAGTCSGKLELICQNLSSRLTLYFDPRNGFFGKKKWPLGILVFQFVGYNTLYLTWALELWDSWTIVYYKSNEITLYVLYGVLKSPAHYKKALMLFFVECNHEELWVLCHHKRKASKTNYKLVFWAKPRLTHPSLKLGPFYQVKSWFWSNSQGL